MPASCTLSNSAIQTQHQQPRQTLCMTELLLSQPHKLRGQLAAACLQATLEDAAFKEHKEEKKLHLAEAAQERRDAPASFSSLFRRRS